MIRIQEDGRLHLFFDLTVLGDVGSIARFANYVIT